ncbi:MAG TPA: F0F1 ATP synthase subunit B [Candidatus Coprenecus pullistercoris]|nr:F0F1 ATP synthase subunit B [Candidatus Coprenecus pullistercoris]
MGLLQPEPGLLIWMTIAFLIVFGLLAKFGFPAIQKTLDERRKYIDSSLKAADEAQLKLEGLQSEMDGVRQDAYKQKSEILKSASDAREKILAEARQRAGEEGERIIAAARLSARSESEAIIRDARHQVAMLSIAISEKLLRERLDNPKAQTELVEKLFSEMEQKKGDKDKEA